MENGYLGHFNNFVNNFVHYFLKENSLVAKQQIVQCRLFKFTAIIFVVKFVSVQSHWLDITMITLVFNQMGWQIWGLEDIISTEGEPYS